MTKLKQISLMAISVALTGCLQEAPKSGDSVSLASVSSAQSVQGLMINGPEVAIIGQPASFTLTSSSPIVSSVWNFGDHTASVNAADSVTHTPSWFGLLTVSVTAIDSQGHQLSASRYLNVIGFYDGLQCVTQTSVQSPAEADAGVPVSVSALIPSCFQSSVSGVNWNFGDGSAVVSGVSASHTFAAEGTYTVLIQIMSPLSEDGSAFITLSRQIHVSTAARTPTPTPNPLACSQENATRESMIGDIYSESHSCGVNGERSDKYQVKLVEACQMNNGVLLWTEISRTPILVSQGACMKQSCSLPDGTLLADGQSRTMYSSSAPAGACSEVSTVRTCNNGQLSGSSSANQMVCHDGCAGFGVNGTVKTGIVIGTVEMPKSCAFGETGINDILQQVVDQTCSDGRVVNSNARSGSVVVAGVCPTYSWVGSENWTTCDADCGGHQSRNFDCRNNKGESAAAERCASQAMPSESRVCDGNPSAVAHVDAADKDEEAGSVGTCPKNQLGVVIQTRTTTTKTSYACIDHAVQVAGTQVSSTPWVQESYCRDYTAHRCSQDSINNTQAQARYEWMVKCQDHVPVIKEFLADFDNVKAAGGYTIDNGTGRHVYPTFMNRATNPEKPWIAPVVKTASCVVPEAAYVAGVCLSSCATPEQEILAQVSKEARIRRVPFLDAVNGNLPVVATLRSEAPMNSRALKTTKVEQWVSEMMDTEHEIRHFKTASGGELRVTPNHPVIAEDGTVKLASDFKVGDNLVKFGGSADRIVSIDEEKYFGKVYNLFVKSANLQENVVVTGGYLNGTAFFQNEGAANMNREILRKNLTRGVFGK